MIKINEIFYSIQGESSLTGFPSVFIRTSGCHLRCNYCDTQYAYYEGKEYSLDDIIKEIKTYSTTKICITGGEPLLQKDIYQLMTQLCNDNYEVSLETSGDKSAEKVDPRVRIIFDVKTPGSGLSNYKFHPNNLPKDLPQNLVKKEYKFVICSEDDFLWAQEFCIKHALFKNNCVLYSPSHNNISLRWLAEKILKENSSARLQLQLHKYIWSEHKRGI